MGSRRQARVAAFQAVYAWEETDSKTEELLSFAWREPPLDEEENLFASLMTSGTLENLEAVDEAIRSCLNRWSFDRLARVDLALLRMSAYALLFRDDIPPSVTIDEAVEIAKSYGTPDSYRFVNGVLDGIRKRALS